MTYTLTAIPVRVLIKQGYFFPHTKLVRLLGMGALLSRN
jgi:hypothetical protein